MADFTVLKFQLNQGNTGAASWVDITGAGVEMRWSDQGTGQLAVASASWPAMIRPAATGIVSYLYAFTADATGNGVYGGGAGQNPAAFSKDNYLQARWNWDNTGTFASAPIYTAYVDTNHNTPAGRGGGGILAGHATDTGATARSYMKGNAWGRVTSGGAPAAGPTNAPTVTDGTTGSVSPVAGANWLTNFQGLMADIDYITAPFTPAATTADQWNVEICLFTGPNQTPATNVNQVSLKYTWT